MISQRKRILSSFAALALASALTVSAAAAGEAERYLPELGMRISLPSELIFLTRDAKENESGLAMTGMDQGTVMEYFEESSIYLDAFPEDVSYEIIVTMTTNSDIEKTRDLRLYSDKELEGFKDGIAEAYGKLGVDFKGYELYERPQARFARIYGDRMLDTGIVDKMVQYSTIVDAKAINITLHSYVGEITGEMEDIARQIADSARFDNPVTEQDIQKHRQSVPQYLPWVTGALTAVVVGIVLAINSGRNKRKAAQRAAAEAAAPPQADPEPWERGE